MRRLKQGDTVGVRGPFGSCWPVEEAEGSDGVIVAGGIGLAPLRPAMYKILSRREQYGKIVLLYGTRTPEDILFRKDLERWRGQFDLDVYVTLRSSHWPLARQRGGRDYTDTQGTIGPTQHCRYGLRS